MVTKFFKRADKGFCPAYHSSDGIMYWVQDHKINHFNGGGEYEYDFICRKECSKTKMSYKQLERFSVKNNLRRTGHCWKTEYFTDGKNDYSYNPDDKTLKTIFPDYVIKYGFKSFKECLEYAENYIAEKYHKTAEQMAIDDYINAKEG